MSRKTARPAEEAERRDLAQNIVCGDSGGLFNLLGPKNGRAGRHVSNHLLGPGDDIDPFFVKPRQLQFNLDGRARLGAKIRLDGLGGEAVCVDTDVIDGGAKILESRPIRRANRRSFLDSLLFCNGDTSAFNDESLGITDRDIELPPASLE
jgi:hypothetical protein